MIRKNRCGIKGLEFNGLEVEIETPSSFMELLLKENEEISSRDSGTIVEFGKQRK